MSKRFWLLLISIAWVIFFLPQNSYASIGVPISNGFDYPLGAPDGKNYGVECCGGLDYLERYDYEGDGQLEYHPGEDWNSATGSDAGAPVYAVSDGLLIYARYAKKDWGYLVLIEHRLAGGERYWTQYAHMRNLDGAILNRSSVVIKRGQVLGHVGDFPNGSNRAYHLHFEIRKKYRGPTDFVFDWPKAQVEQYYVYPSEFIKANRPLPPPTPQKLSVVASGKNGATLSWDEAVGKEFERYELYRSEDKDTKGEKIFSATDTKLLSHTDTNLYAEQDYYYRILTYYKNGQIAESNEVSLKLKREFINLSNAPGVQRYAGINGNKVFWEDVNREQTSFPQKRTLYYYDIEKGETQTITIGSVVDNVIQGPYKPQISADWLCYYGKKRTGSYDIYCRNLASDMSADYQITNTAGDENDPQVFGDVVVWQGFEGSIRRIFWTNLAEGTEIHELTETPGQQYTPRIWDNNILWINQSATGQPKDLLSKNLETGAESVIATDIGNGTIDIWNYNVIYGKDNKLTLAKISNPENTTTIIEDGLNARMNDGKIVYTKVGTGGKYYIYVYNLTTKKTLNVAGPLTFQPSPVIYENMLAYDASPNESPLDMDIFLTYL